MQIAGYFSGVMGTGEHARQLAAALRTGNVALTLRTVEADASPEDPGLQPVLPPAVRERNGAKTFECFNLLAVNADMVPAVAPMLGPDFFERRYTIGFWAWEVSSFPSSFVGAFNYVDEVWVGSRHVRDAIAPVSPVPVIAIPQPVSLAESARDAHFSAPLPDGFRFLFAFDYLSVFERKNPLSTIAAFEQAFDPGSGATLVVKALNPEVNRSAHERLQQAAQNHPDIHLMDTCLSREDRDGLMNAVDCYVSLHRAEGFGYTLAESMWLGKPVIATGYSGNLDFMTEENSYLVDHQLVRIGTGSEPYPAHGVWAQPDISHAARLMREVFENRADANRRGERAAADIRRTHGLETAGKAMLERLETLQRAGVRSRHSGSSSMKRFPAERSAEPPERSTASPPRPHRSVRFGRLRRLVRGVRRQL